MGAAHALRRHVVIRLFCDAAVFDHLLCQLEGVHRFVLFDQITDEGVEAAHFFCCACVDIHIVFQRGCQCLPEADVMELRCRCDLTYGHIADAPCGVVDGSAKSLLIAPVDDNAEVADHILDLFSLVE